MSFIIMVKPGKLWRRMWLRFQFQSLVAAVIVVKRSRQAADSSAICMGAKAIGDGK